MSEERVGAHREDGFGKIDDFAIVGGPPAEQGLAGLKEPHTPTEWLILTPYLKHLRLGGEELSPEVGSIADECEDSSHRRGEPSGGWTRLPGAAG